MTDRAIAHLEALRQDVRDEVKRRIEQRDHYSIQMTIALGAIVAVSFSPKGFGRALIAAPLVSIYFTVLILYSYRIHRLIATYLRETVEPELARLCGTSPDLECETYCRRHSLPGIRRPFFLIALWVLCAGSLAYLWLAERGGHEFTIALSFLSAVYLAAAAWITAAFWKG